MNLAENIATCRKQLNLTQLQLAEKLNYSDKAVSKWERGDSVPDIETLKNLADYFGVTVDYLLSEPNNQLSKPTKKLPKKRLIISLCSAGLVWLVAIVVYAFLGLLIPSIVSLTWLSFIWALPITFIVLIVLTSVWGKNLWNLIFSSLLAWTLLLALYLTLLYFTQAPNTLWMLFLIGIPVQVLLGLWFTYIKVK